MKCFDHPEMHAVGICKSCHKGLCLDCAVDVGMGLACRDSCETRVSELSQMNERSLSIYGIGKYKTKMPASGVLMWGVLTILTWGLIGLLYFKTGSSNAVYPLIAVGVFFTIVTGFAYYSSRRTGLNC